MRQSNVRILRHYRSPDSCGGERWLAREDRADSALAMRSVRHRFSARRHTPLYQIKTPSRRMAEVMTEMAEGVDTAAASRIFNHHPKTIAHWVRWWWEWPLSVGVSGWCGG
ncbi:MAG TPA: hypothetical protein VHO84_12300, partial [Syntrophorhabdaceae bacterium]|nr:hypothetical protein [Syntrophorhabdaceae bacterium]